MIKLLAFNHQSNKIYFQATKTDQIQSRHIYELKLSSNKRSSDYLKCLTCDLHLLRNSLNTSINQKSINTQNKSIELTESKEENEKSDNLDNSPYKPINFTIQNSQINDKITSSGKWIINCDNYDASFSVDFKYFVLICNGPTVPYIELWQNEPVLKRGMYFHDFT